MVYLVLQKTKIPLLMVKNYTKNYLKYLKASLGLNLGRIKK